MVQVAALGNEPVRRLLSESTIDAAFRVEPALWATLAAAFRAIPLWLLALEVFVFRAELARDRLAIFAHRIFRETRPYSLPIVYRILLAMP